MIKIEKETAKRMLHYNRVLAMDVIEDDSFLRFLLMLSNDVSLEFRVTGNDCSSMEYEFLRKEWGES